MLASSVRRRAIAVAFALAAIALTAAITWALRPGPPNVVLVIGCTVRRDLTTPYGGHPEATPFLARLAAEGVRFDDVMASAPWTREAVAALLTGTNSARFGLPDPGPGVNRRVLGDAATTLAERLAAAGYDTIGVSANPNLTELYGLAQGFEWYAGPGERAFSTAVRQDGGAVVDRALAFLDGRSDPDRPFYLQVVTIDTHLPRAASPREVGRFRDLRAPRKVLRYVATLRRVDDALARLDHGLRQRGHDARDTLFAFVADHGEGLFLPEHHGGAHGTRMYRSTLSVPLLVRGPGVPAGGVVEGLVSGEDLAPTILGLLGLPSGGGRDWSGLVRRGGRADRERAFAMSMFGDVDLAAVWTPTTQCQRDFGSDRGHRMQDGCADRLRDPDAFDLHDDPALLAELAEWRATALAEGGRHRVVVARDDETERQLEALGYVE